MHHIQRPEYLRYITSAVLYSCVYYYVYELSYTQAFYVESPMILYSRPREQCILLFVTYTAIRLLLILLESLCSLLKARYCSAWLAGAQSLKVP